MNTNQTLREAIPQILRCLEEYQYSKEYLATLKRHFNRVVSLYEKNGVFTYEPGQYQQFLSCIEQERLDKKLRIDLFWYYRKCAYFIDEFFRCGSIHPKMLVRNNKEMLSKDFNEMLERYLDSLKFNISKSTIQERRMAICRYLRYLQSQNHNSFESVSVNDVQRYFILLTTEISNRTLNQNRLHIRQFHHFLFDKGIFSPEWISFLDFHIVVPRKIQGYLSFDETNSFMQEIDRSTGSGKRDYAIISLVKTTGLRGGDIVDLNLSDIDWGQGIITITQKKTGVKIQLPLLFETGEAIKDYILNGCPQTDSKKIFVRINAPYTPLQTTASLDAILAKYQQKVNFDKKPWDGKAFHGARRGLGRELILSDVPVTTVTQILGHSNLDSTKPYIMLNTNELKECALDFKDIPLKRGELV